MEEPKFNLMELDNYNDKFLKEVIRWQAKKIKELKQGMSRYEEPEKKPNHETFANWPH